MTLRSKFYLLQYFETMCQSTKNNNNYKLQAS